MEAKIKSINGKPAVVVDGEIIPPMAFTMSTMKRINSFSAENLTTYELILNPEYLQRIGKSGIRLFYLITDTEWGRKGANETFDREARALLKAVPNAYIMVRIGLHPSKEWVLEHPEECFTYNDGSKPPVNVSSESLGERYPHLYSLASEVWLNDATKALNKTCDYFDKLPYADRIIGYFFGAGATSEWGYLLFSMTEDGRYGDFSLAFKRYFSKYLKEKYVTDKNLQEAWKNAETTIENPVIPSLNARYHAHQIDKELVFDDEKPIWNDQDMPTNGTNIGNFLDVDNQMATYDFYRAFHLATADSQLHFARFIKKRYDGKKLTGSFYGSYGCTDFYSTSTAGGVMRILEDPSMDFLAAPGAYSNRNPGGFTGQREMLDSFRLHNKIFMAEEDTRTHLDPAYYRDLFDYYNSNDSVNVIKRDFGRIIADGEYGWWFDQTIGGGRYDDKDILETFEKQQKIAKRIYSGNESKNNDIAFIYDEESIHAVSDITTKEIVEYFRNYEIAKIGTGVDHYFHNDLACENMPDYKVYVFFNTFVLTDSEREIIKKKLAKNHAIAVWVYASGAINPQKSVKFNQDNVSSLIGMKMNRLDERWSSKFKFDSKQTVLTGFDQDKFYGEKDRPLNHNILVSQRERKTYLCPVFYPEDNTVNVLARYVGNGLPAVAIKDTGEYTSIYYGAKVMRSDFIKSVARYAGVHLCIETDDVFYFGNGLMTIHASSTGRKKIRLPKKYKITESYSGVEYGVTDEITIDMKKGETQSFYYEKENV